MKLSIKNSLTLIIAILFAFQGLVAQTPDNRTNQTIVADALAQLPAFRIKNYTNVIKALVETGEEGILTLVEMMDPSGKVSNEKVEFALTGWTNTVATDKAKSAIAAAAYGKALAKPLDNKIKQFVMRQIELIGNDNNVDVLGGFLSDEYLAGPASQALANINTPKSVDKLLAGLASAKSDYLKQVLVNAIGQTGNAKAEAGLLKLINKSNSDAFNAVLFTAISKVGTTASIQAMKQAATAENYLYSRSNATAAYVNLLNKLTVTNPAEVQTAATDLMVVANSNKINHLRIAALELLMELSTVNKYDLLVTALKDNNVAYLAKALSLYTNYTDDRGTNLVVKSLKKSKQETAKTTMIYWLGDRKVATAAPLITKSLKSDNLDLQKSAIVALSEIGGENTLKALVKLLQSKNATTLANVHDALASYVGNMSNELKAKYASMSEEGKVIALDLMSLRKMTDQYNLVYNQMSVGKDSVQLKAVKTLKDVASVSSLPELFTQIEKGESKYLADIQAAINAVLSSLPENEQLALINERMNKSDKPYAFYVSLANTGTASALDIILKGHALGGKNAAAAFDALLNLNAFDAIYPLREVARTSKKEVEINQATDAMINLIKKSTKTGIVKANYYQEVMAFAKTEKQQKEILTELGSTNSFQALLFLEKYLSDKKLGDTAAQAGQKIVMNNPQFAGKTTNLILEKISKALNNRDAEYQRQAIETYFEMYKDIEGYVPLFNGKDLTGWKGLVGNPITRAKMTPEALADAQFKADQDAAQAWVVEDGQLVFTGKGKNLCTVKQYADFEMMVDWKLYPGKEPDAGIYLRGTPQVQIWDTARVKVGAQVGSGGLYNNKVNVSKPLTVADQKLGEWNTFHIKMVGDHVTVYLNGELVTNNVILENYFDRKQPIFPIEQIELQAHGSKVAYRNIYIKEIPRPEPFKLSPEEEKEGYEVLFDGTNMHKWTGNTTEYVTEDGCIVITPKKGSGGNLYTKEEFGNFIFRFQFQLTPRANNGLGIRTPMEGDAAYLGMELQILDNEASNYSRLKDYQYHGSVYGIIPAKRGYLKPVGEWNYQEVVADGDNIKVTLNGTVILDGNIREATKANGPADGKEHPGLFNKTGHIGFLGHGSVVKFKEIRIKRLK